MAERTRGDLAIVLHSHMPYVEGFGTYPFGEEWLFDAFARSHLPVLDEADHYTKAMRRLSRLGGNPLRAFQEAPRKGRIALMPSAATHAVLPKLATIAGRRLQVDAGLRSHERRFSEPDGFWLPECAYVP